MRVTRPWAFLWGQSTTPITDRIPRGHFIGGAFHRPEKGRELVASSPSDELTLCTVARVGKEHVDAAVGAARAATPAWQRKTEFERATALLALATAIEKRKQLFADAEALCSGMCWADAAYSVQSSADTFRHFASVMLLPRGEILPSFGDGRKNRAHSVREPCGVVGLITPFNFPLEMGAWKLAPALAAGNTVVWKPPEEAPLTAQLLAQCVAEDCGSDLFPPGTVNIAHGMRSEGEHLVAHNGVDIIGFTGSTKAGVAIQVAAAQANLKRCNLELGGNATVLVCDDFSIPKAAEIAMACFYNSGQSCTSARRIYVPRAGHMEFLKCVVERVKERKLGHALDHTTQQGPMISGNAMERVIEEVKAAERRGAGLVCGGYRAVFTKGYFVAPTVVTDIDHADPLVQDESFGPVMVVLPYDDLATAVAQSQDTTYGLSANVLTNNVDRAAAIVDALRAGTVWVNGADEMTAATPFGGIRKSGYGKDLGVAALDSYSNHKTVITVHATTAIV